ncbi:MAG: hypothetical protein HRU36_01110 [Rickettsiales bacterium]|nr:hypothetical protein [Rickettsiales bacterium]
MTDIFKEIEQDLQREKFHLFAKKHYKGIIAFIAVIFVIIAFYFYLRNEAINEQEQLSEEYYNLFIADNKIDKIKEGDFGKLIPFKKSIYSKFARFQYVNSLVQNKEYTRAIQLLLSIIEDSEKEPEISNLAKIKAAELVMKYEVSKYNEKILDILKKTTKKAAKKDNEPYLYMIKLLLGQLLIETNQRNEGLNVLGDLHKDDKTPQNIKFFSNAILENYLKP